MKIPSKQLQTKNAAPIKSFMAGGVKLAIWLNDVKTDNGTYEVPSFTIAKSYKDDKGEWKQTQSFKVQDLARLNVVLMQAQTYLLTKEYTRSEEDSE